MHKQSIAIAIVSCLALAGCAQNAAQADPFSNPLYAEWYYKDLTEGMMALEIREDPLLEDERMSQKVDSIRRDALAKSQEQTQRIRQGRQGPLMPGGDEDVRGRVLLLGSTLYFGPETNIRPGYDLHLYLTSQSDPAAPGGSGASLVFPDASAVDLGVMYETYGPSAREVPASEGDPYRAVVLWDKALKRMHAFAQLQ